MAMDLSQGKALAVLQPFVHLATTTKTPSPRVVAELIKNAISAPGAFVFTELLQTPACQSLHGTEFKSWLTLLEIYCWGTYEEYHASPGLPTLNEAQTFKLRQLSLLTLASPFAPTAATGTNTLTYPSLLQALALPDVAALESLVTQSIYSGLLTACLSPTSTPPVVNITSVAPLRDLRPQSLPTLLQILQTWESRCSSVVDNLESQIARIRRVAAQRHSTERKRQSNVDTAVLNDKPGPTNNEMADAERRGAARGMKGVPQRLPSKRDLDQQMEGEGEDASDDENQMEVDEGIAEVGHHGASSRGGHGAGVARGAKRNRGRGGK